MLPRCTRVLRATRHISLKYKVQLAITSMLIFLLMIAGVALYIRNSTSQHDKQVQEPTTLATPTPTITCLNTIVPVTVIVVAYETIASIASPLIPPITTITLPASTSTPSTIPSAGRQLIEPPDYHHGWIPKPLPKDKDDPSITRWLPWVISVVLMLLLIFWIVPPIITAWQLRREHYWYDTLQRELVNGCDPAREGATFGWATQACRGVWTWLKARCEAVLNSGWCKGGDGELRRARRWPWSTGDVARD